MSMAATRPDIVIRRLSPALGAEICGVDAGAPAGDMSAILDAWRDHLVLLFRNQNISPAQQAEFAARFGAIHSRARPRSEAEKAADLARTGHPNIMFISNVRENGRLIRTLPDGEMQFHADLCYRQYPTLGAFLYAIEVPKTGGETHFLNLFAAYKALPETLKRRIEGKTALNIYAYDVTSRDANEAKYADAPRYSHPIVRVQPGTGRKAIYINRLMTSSIDGMERGESEKLLEELFGYMEQPDFIYSHRWLPGDLLLWNNLYTLHARSDFDAQERRILRRIALQGGPEYEVPPGQGADGH